jgi:hypothetical protein
MGFHARRTLPVAGVLVCEELISGATVVAVAGTASPSVTARAALTTMLNILDVRI